jgi:hypothetical protein
MKVAPQVVVVPNLPGTCRWCRCTYEHACDGGCAWTNQRQQTLCTACEPLDRAMRTNAGRRELATFLQEQGFLVGVPQPPALRPIARRRAGRR